ncbi:TetR family transcriptional regulator [Pseudomonas sp. L-22-4S-12]|uniref:TetR/AcrR family transcriptional regulator n=1 Tax=Pseudomonas sp. L-22-4S-12 TaxID=2610893 RepID=UPI00132194F4|nr:TetR/AcrR family transcriptional regulator [Pseudomonas sp. L-22-4S-12]MWV17035.1 TetR family transcriptional regulator [Pseudomonas sp. L-22-4S-12]
MLNRTLQTEAAALKDTPTQAGGEVLLVELTARQRKLPRQARSIALVEALKKAGRDILEQDSRAGLSVYRLADYSGVAISSIYEYFPTIEALVGAIFDDYREEARQEVITSLANLPATATLLDGIEMVLGTGLAALHRWMQIDSELSIKAAYHAELVRLDLVKAERFWSSMVIPTLVERFSDEVLVRDREKAGFLAYQAVIALPRALLLERPQYLLAPDTVRLLARMIHALLTTPDLETRR